MSSKRPRCSYHEGARRCTKAGYGNPPLCRAHALILEDEDEEGDPLDDLYDEILDRFDSFTDRITQVISSRLSSPPSPPPRRPAPRKRPSPEPRRGARQPPPPPPQAPPQDPREILGFPPGTNPTKREIKARQKRLAAIFHPDVGGSLVAMQKLNEAVQILLKTAPA